MDKILFVLSTLFQTISISNERRLSAQSGAIIAQCTHTRTFQGAFFTLESLDAISNLRATVCVYRNYLSLQNNTALYEILSNANSSYTQGCSNIYEAITRILLEFTRVIFKVVL